MSEIEILGLDEIEIENTSVEEIDSENINLIFVGVDKSGSMGGYVRDMQGCLAEFKDALINSKESDEILVARGDFNDDINIGGYKRINEFDITYSASGMTALYDVVFEGSEKLIKYMDFLKQQGMRVKAVFAIFSDGEDTSSKNKLQHAKHAIKNLNDAEITTAFISFGQGAKQEAIAMGFKNILSVGSSATELRQAFNCLSKSVIEASKSVVADDDDFFVV